MQKLKLALGSVIAVSVLLSVWLSAEMREQLSNRQEIAARIADTKKRIMAVRDLNSQDREIWLRKTSPASLERMLAYRPDITFVRAETPSRTVSGTMTEDDGVYTSLINAGGRE